MKIRNAMKYFLSIVLAIVMIFSNYTYKSTDTHNVYDVEASQSYGLRDNIQDVVILHCFNWGYNDIKAELPRIAEAGFTSVQTSPAQQGVNSGT